MVLLPALRRRDQLAGVEHAARDGLAFDHLIVADQRVPHGAADHPHVSPEDRVGDRALGDVADRKSTRLNSSHQIISYAVFCLKKKNKPSATSDAISMPRFIGTGWRTLASFLA